MSSFEHLPHDEQMKRLQRLAAAALLRYELPGDIEPHLVNLSENATYRVECPSTGRKWALRVHREGYHSKNAIASELAWLNALRKEQAVVTPTPIAGKNGELIQVVAHEAVPNARHVVLFDWENGIEPAEDQHDLRQPFEVLGEIAARMHVHVHHWQKPANFERLTWDFETSLGSRPHWGSWRDGMGLTPEIEELFAQTVDLIRRRLERFGKSKERFNLIHCDMRLANLLIDGDTTKIIDFDDCGFSWLMYDCATTVSFFEHKPEVPELIQAWLRGYRKVIDLPKEDEEEIPTFVMLRRLLLVAWIGSHSETELAQSMGVDYTQGTVPLCQTYLSRFS
jgi:Ser/Thr protein kinase RdoA (MazF antagonist)